MFVLLLYLSCLKFSEEKIPRDVKLQDMRVVVQRLQERKIALKCGIMNARVHMLIRNLGLHLFQNNFSTQKCRIKAALPAPPLHIQIGGSGGERILGRANAPKSFDKSPKNMCGFVKSHHIQMKFIPSEKKCW